MALITRYLLNFLRIIFRNIKEKSMNNSEDHSRKYASIKAKEMQKEY